MQRVHSLQEFPTIISQMAPAGILISYTTNSLSHLIKTTRGKERLLSLFQYIAELFKLTMQDYIRSKQIPASIYLLNAISIEKSMKNGRKLMRVLMFIDDINSIESIWKSRPLNTYKCLQVLLNISNIVYYILDNLLYCADIGIISKFISNANIKWKDTKDSSSVARALIGVVLSGMTLVKTWDQIKKSRQRLEEKMGKKIRKGSRKLNEIEILVDARREFRFKAINAFIMNLRLVMLGHALGFPVLKRCSNIFVATCGIIVSALSIFAVLIGEQVARVVEQPKFDDAEN